MNNTEMVNTQNNATKRDGWCWAAVISFICGAITLIMGIHKLVFYDNGDYYPYKVVNAYVGSDRYDYIINGTRATALFVLTTMFVLAAIGFIIIHYVAKKSPSVNYEGLPNL